VTGPINLGNPGEFTMLELARLVIEMTGSRSKITHGPKPADDPRQRRPNIERAGQVLGWKPRTDLVTGLRATIAYFDHLLSRNTQRAFQEAAE
jgi:UDP-glucuronate decarboxylase